MIVYLVYTTSLKLKHKKLSDGFTHYESTHGEPAVSEHVFLIGCVLNLQFNMPFNQRVYLTP